MSRSDIMRIWHFSTAPTIILNVAGWLFLHMLIAFGATRLSRRLFHENQWLYRIRSWEKDGALYRRLFNVTQWKGLLPDGAAWFRGGFAKKKMDATDQEYLDLFVKETCRGEFTHWIVIAVSPLFFLWNGRLAGGIMITYALAANLPCIIVQRYNRPQLLRILAKKKERVRKSAVDSRSGIR
ncbi:MAG: hypothetical protein JXA18_13290 [Chitinispirillaceae bacterium]|nr:hypothetical protein [Chitinispirillaceae bacterium]